MGAIQQWEVYDATGDAHPTHVHLVYFEVMHREGFTAPLIDQPVAQHDGTLGMGFRLGPITLDGVVRGPDPTKGTRRDMVMALPGEVTRIKMTVTKAGRYVWHCHIVSHEEHEMMRPFHVGPGPF